jgi:hypothetical protein
MKVKVAGGGPSGTSLYRFDVIKYDNNQQNMSRMEYAKSIL